MTYTLIAWGWLVVSLALLILVLSKFRRGPFRPIRCFFVGGLMLQVAAGLCNAVVMTANGARMPVEEIDDADWDTVSSFLDGPSARQSCLCRMLVGVDNKVNPQPHDHAHFDVPKSRFVQGDAVAHAPHAHPRLAVLDDRHPVRICGQKGTYSKGDIFGALGAVLLFIGFILSLFRFVLRLLFRRTKNAPTSR